MAKKARKIIKGGNILDFLSSLVGSKTPRTKTVQPPSRTRSVNTHKTVTASKKITSTNSSTNISNTSTASNKVQAYVVKHKKREVKALAKALRMFDIKPKKTPASEARNIKRDKKELAKAFYDIMKTKKTPTKKKAEPKTDKNVTEDNTQNNTQNNKTQNNNTKNNNTYEEQKKFTEDNFDNFMGLLLNKIMKANQNPQNVLNDVITLQTFLRELVTEYPSYRDIANKFFEETKIRLEYGAYKDEGRIHRLVEEFTQNPYRRENRDGIAYDTGILDINAGIFLEAIYRTFKDEAFEKGITNVAFRRALDFLLVNKPYELYEGYLNSNGNISRTRKLLSPREIADMAMSRAQSLRNVNIV